MNVENRKEFRSRFFSKKVIVTGIVNTNFWFKFFNFTDAVLAYGKYRLLFDVEKNPGPSAYRENTTARDEAKSWTFVDGQKVYNVYSEQQLYDLDAKTNELQKLINDCNNGKGGKDDIDKYTGRKLLNYQKRCEMLNTPPIIIATTKTQNLYAPLLKSGKRTAVDVNVTPGGKMCTIFINEDQRVYTKPLDSVSVKTVFEVFSGTRYSTEVDYGRSAALYLLYLHKSNEYDPKMVIKNEMYDATQVALIIDGADKICDSQQPVKSINGIDVNDFIPTYGPPLMDEEEIDVKQKAAEVSLRAINAEKKTPSSELELEMRIQKEKRDIAKTGATQQRLTLEERANNKDRLLQANLTNTRNANRSADAPAPSTQVIANKDRNQGKSVHSLYNRVQAIYMSAKTPKVLINVLLNQALKNVLFVSTLASLIVKYQTHVAAFSRDNALTGDLDNLNVILAWVAHFFVSKDTEKVNRENIAIFFVRLITTTTIYPTIHMDTKVCPICYVLNLLDLKESHGIFSSVVPGAPFEYEGPTDQTVLLNKNNANVTKAWALRHNQEMHALNGNIAYTTKFSGDNILKTTMRYFESADRQMFTQASQHRLQEIPYHPTDVLNNPVCLMQVQVNKQKAAAPVIRPVNMLMDTVLYSNTPAAQRGVLVGQRGLGRGVIAKDGLATVPYGSQIAYNVGQTYGTSSLSFEPTTTGMACEKLANAQVGDANQMDSVLSIAKQSNTQSTVSEQLSLASIMSTFCSPTSQSGTLNFIMKAVGYQAAKTPTPCRTSNIDGEMTMWNLDAPTAIGDYFPLSVNDAAASVNAHAIDVRAFVAWWRDGQSNNEFLNYGDLCSGKLAIVPVKKNLVRNTVNLAADTLMRLEYPFKSIGQMGKHRVNNKGERLQTHSDVGTRTVNDHVTAINKWMALKDDEKLDKDVNPFPTLEEVEVVATPTVDIMSTYTKMKIFGATKILFVLIDSSPDLAHLTLAYGNNNINLPIVRLNREGTIPPFIAGLDIIAFLNYHFMRITGTGWNAAVNRLVAGHAADGNVIAIAQNNVARMCNLFTPIGGSYDDDGTERGIYSRPSPTNIFRDRDDTANAIRVVKNKLSEAVFTYVNGYLTRPLTVDAVRANNHYSAYIAPANTVADLMCFLGLIRVKTDSGKVPPFAPIPGHLTLSLSFFASEIMAGMQVVLNMLGRPMATLYHSSTFDNLEIDNINQLLGLTAADNIISLSDRFERAEMLYTTVADVIAYSMGTWINIDHTANFVENHNFYHTATANMPIAFQVITNGFTNTTRKINLGDMKWQNTNMTDEEGLRIQKLQGILAMSPEDQVNFMHAVSTISDPRVQADIGRMVDYEERRRKNIPSTRMATEYWNSYGFVMQQQNTLYHDGDFINVWANPFVYDVSTGRPTVPYTSVESAFSSISGCKVEFLTTWTALNKAAVLEPYDKNAIVLDALKGTLGDIKTDPGDGATVEMQLAKLMAEAAEIRLVQEKLLALSITNPPASADANSKMSMGGDTTANLNQSENPNLTAGTDNKSPPPPGVLLDKTHEREEINKSMFPKNVSFQT
jgi:hypothetical protein